MSAGIGQRLAAIAVTCVAVAGIALGSATTIPFHSDDAALLRLSWSARPERIERCRALSDEELEERSEHMRQRVECEGRFATYTVEIAVDGRPVEQEVVTGGGIRNDRPIHHLREIDLPTGERRIRVSLQRREPGGKHRDADEEEDEEEEEEEEDEEEGSGISANRGERERAERARRERTALPAALELDTTLTIVAGQVVVVTFDAEQRTFVVVRAPG